MKYISIKYQIFQFHAFNTEKGRNTIEGQRSAEYYYYIIKVSAKHIETSKNY